MNVKRQNIFKGDVVAKKECAESVSTIGMVLRTSYDEVEVEDSDENNSDELDAGDIVVALLDWSAPTISKETLWVVVDRLLGVGDTVKKSPDALESGTVVNVKATVDLVQCSTGKKICSIPTTEIKFIRDIEEGMLVSHGDWAGQVVHVNDRISVVFSDGSICVPADPMDLYCPGVDDESLLDPYDFFPGQPIMSHHLDNFSTGTWIKRVGRGRPDLKSGKVFAVDTVTAQVAWCVCNPLLQERSEQPDEEVPVSMLKVYSSQFDKSTFQIGDRVTFVDPKQAVQVLGIAVDSDDAPEFKYYSSLMVVQTSVNVVVQWQDSTVTDFVPATSLVPHAHIDENDFYPRDFVTRLDEESDVSRLGLVMSVNNARRTVLVRWFYPTEEQLEGAPDEVSVYEIKLSDSFQFQAGDRVAITDSSINLCHWLGEVLRVMEDGLIHIRFFDDGQYSFVPPRCLLMLGEAFDLDSSEYDDTHYSDNLDDDNWETDNEDTVKDESDSKMELEEDSILTAAGSMPTAGHDIGLQEIDEPAQDLFKFQPLAPVNHYYLNQAAKSLSGGFMKRVHKEYAILQHNLPKDIFVRAFEDRVDLFRILIIGPKHTPYEDGVFLFDMMLPPDFPGVPPLVHFHSVAGRLNPNLYHPDGKVCLSLLGTWSGKSNEQWSPLSNILQVLLSIQGLVLTRHPYFNEAGYERQLGTVEGLTNSKFYSEKVFLLVLKTMIHYIDHPLEPFVSEIKQHFERKGGLILSRAQIIIDNSRAVGEVSQDLGADCDIGFPVQCVSAGCLRLLVGTVADLRKRISG